MNRFLCRIGFAVALAAFATSCASTPNTIINADPQADFTQYKSYAFMSQLSTDSPKYDSLLTNFLKAAMSKEMDKRGIEYSTEPDILINFFTNTREKITSRTVPTSGAYYGYRGSRYGAWGAYETRIDQVTEGSLTIDIVDTSALRLIWEGTVTGRVTDKKLRDLEGSVDRAVSALMADYPIAPLN